MNTLKQFHLDGRVAVITGAANGLGAQFTEAMAEAGAHVVCADIDLAGAQASAERARALGRQALAVTCDVSQEAQVVALFDQALQAFGQVDIVFANAGIGDRTPQRLHQSETRDWNAVLAVNLQGVYYTDREALKIMQRQKRGKVINVASMWGLAGAASVMPVPAYAATKGAVVNLTRELALEYARSNIQVNALCPGFFQTRMVDKGAPDAQASEALTSFTPMGRLARPEEIKGAALFLASDASSFVTGSMLVIDGGCMAK